MKVFQKIATITGSELQSLNFSGWYIRQVISVKEVMSARDPALYTEKIYHVLLEKEIDG